MAGKSSDPHLWNNSFSRDYQPARIYRMVTGEIKIEYGGKKIILKSPGLYWIPPTINVTNTALGSFSHDWLYYESDDLKLRSKMLETP